jgi:hypothetical protein
MVCTYHTEPNADFPKETGPGDGGNGKLLHTQLSVKPIRPRCTLKPAKLKHQAHGVVRIGATTPCCNFEQNVSNCRSTGELTTARGASGKLFNLPLFGQFCFGQTGVSENLTIDPGISPFHQKLEPGCRDFSGHARQAVAAACSAFRQNSEAQYSLLPIPQHARSTLQASLISAVCKVVHGDTPLNSWQSRF